MKLNQDLEEILRKHFGTEIKNLQEQAVIFSVYSLSPDEVEKITVKFPQLQGKHITNIVDASIIGGFVITYGSKMIDVSLRGALQSLRNKLYEE